MAWGRIALLHAAEQAEKQLNDMAKTLGYLADENTPVIQKQSRSPDVTSNVDSNKDIIQTGQKHASFWQVQGITERKKPEKTDRDYLDDSQKVIDLKQPQTGTYIFDPPSAIVSSANLLPLIVNALGDKRASNRVDSKKLLKCELRAKS